VGKVKKPKHQCGVTYPRLSKKKTKKRKEEEGRKKQRKKMNPKSMLMWMCQGLLVDQLHQSRMTTKI